MIKEELFNRWGFSWVKPIGHYEGYWVYKNKVKKLAYYPKDGWCYVNSELKLTTIDLEAFKKLFFETFGEQLT